MPTPSEIRAFNSSVIEEFHSSNGHMSQEILRVIPLAVIDYGH